MTTKQARRRGRRARPARKPPRVLPRARWVRVLIYLAVVLGYMAVMWLYVFPWVDRTFVNRPAL